MPNLTTLTDIELAENVRYYGHNPSMVELINRHSGVYFKVASNYIGNPMVDFNEVKNNKDFTIFQAALEYDENKGAFSTFVGTMAKHECWREVRDAKKQKKIFKVEITPENGGNYKDSTMEYTDLVQYLDKESKLEDDSTKEIFKSRFIHDEKPKPWRKIGKEIGYTGQACLLKNKKFVRKLRENLKGEK